MVMHSDLIKKLLDTQQLCILKIGEINKMSNTKFSYIHDPKNKHRVMTIARDVEDGTIFFGYSINRSIGNSFRPNMFDSQIVTTIKAHPIDQFNKKIGRSIAEGRMNRNRGELEGVTSFVSQVEGEAPHITVLKHLTKSKNQLVRRMCKHYLNEGCKKFVAPAKNVRFV